MCSWKPKGTARPSQTGIRSVSVYGDMVSGRVPNSYPQHFSKSIETVYEQAEIKTF